MRYYAAILLCFCAFGQVPSTPQTASPDVKADAKCSIEGTIVNSVTGEPVRKARVHLIPLGKTVPIRYATTTDASGHYLINEVDAGRYALEAYREGYSYRLTKGVHTFTLEPGQELKDIALKLTPMAVVNGRILDEDGDPVSNVTVDCMRFRYVKGVRQLLPEGHASTNDAGDFRLSISTAGKCAIRATPPSKETDVYERPIGQVHGNTVVAQQEYVATYYPQTTNPSSASPVEVTPGAQINGITVSLMRGVSFHIRGRVKAATTLSPARTFVQLHGWDMAPGFTIVDSKGGFQFTDVAPGSYSLHALQVMGDKRYSVSVPVNVVDQNIEGIELAPQPPGTIQGRVVFEEKGELKGKVPRLMVSTMTGFVGKDIAVEDDLTFKVDDLTAESYRVGMPGGVSNNTYIKSVRLGEQEVLDTGFDVIAGAEVKLTVYLSPHAGVIEGSVKNAKDEVATAVLVTLIPAANDTSTRRRFKIANTDQNGHFKIEGIVPGEYKIYAWEEIEDGAYEDPDFMKLHEADGEAVSIKESTHESVNLRLIAADGASDTSGRK